METKIENNYNLGFIPQTRIDSFRQLIESGQLSDLKKLCTYLLTENYESGLTRPEISIISGIPEHSLTSALLLLCKEGKVFVSGVRINLNSNRNNQVYKLISND